MSYAINERKIFIIKEMKDKIGLKRREETNKQAKKKVGGGGGGKIF